MERQWKFSRDQRPEVVRDLTQSLKIDRILASLLHKRNINSFEEARLFFRPDHSQLHDPFLMKGMDEAVERIQKAINEGEKVLVFGDYDVDGTTAVSIIYSFFSGKIKELDYYIPDRHKEGYGISYEGIDFAASHGFALVIALDCGIKSVDKIFYAVEKGIDFIICDHHLPGDELPPAIAILDPKQHGCGYPYKELSGAGIAFKLIQAFSIRNDLPAENCYEYLDLVVTSIASDIVPITGENRVLAYYGLKEINSDPRPGIKAILNISQVKGEIGIHTLVFVLGPRINAAGRIEHGSKAVELLICDNQAEADNFAGAINDTNTLRKDIDLGITTEAMDLLEQETLVTSKKTTVLFNGKWHKGVIGIVASRLIEKYYRPTIILTEYEGMVTGSARSVREYDVYGAIEKCGDLLEQFGGHRFAAGLTLRRENVEAFRDRFEEVVAGTITDDQLTPRIEIDAEIGLHEITPKLLRLLRQFAPHGPENMTPVFCCRNLFDTGWAQVIGSNHLKAELFQKDNPNIRFQIIAFDKGDYINFLQRKIPMDIVFKIQENAFRGTRTVQLVVEDMRVSGN